MARARKTKRRGSGEWSADEQDARILNALTADGRMSARQLGLRLGMSTVTIISRVKKMEEAGIVRGYTVQLDHEKLGYELTAVVEVATRSGIHAVEKRLASMECVCGVYDVTGDTDIVVIAKFRGRPELDSFVKGLAKVPDITNTVTRLVLNTVKEDYRLT